MKPSSKTQKNYKIRTKAGGPLKSRAKKSEKKVNKENDNPNQHSVRKVVRIELNNDPEQLMVEGVNNAIYEYLIKLDMKRTLQCFKKELKGTRFQPLEDFHKMMIGYFEQGKMEEFFKCWDYYIPLSLRKHDKNTIKAEFFLMIFFCIYDIHPYVDRIDRKLRLGSVGDVENDNGAISDDQIFSYIRKEKINFKESVDEIEDLADIDLKGYERAMCLFREYLNRQGDELTKLDELIPYFALPYLKEPTNHPTFRKLFSRSWVVKIKKLLFNFLGSLYHPETKPFLIGLYERFFTNPNKDEFISRNVSRVTTNSIRNKDERGSPSMINENKELMIHIKSLQAKIDELEHDRLRESNKHVKTFENAEELFAVLKESFDLNATLIDFAQMFKSGREFFVEKAEKKFAELRELVSEDSFKSKAENSLINELKSKESESNRFNKELLKMNLTENIGKNFVFFDVTKLKDSLIKDNDGSIRKDFLSFSKQLISCSDDYMKRAYAIIFMEEDLLGLKQNNPEYSYTMFLDNEDHSLLYLNLLNDLTIDFYFRQNLSKENSFIGQLITLFKESSQEAEKEQLILQILQKMSLQAKTQKEMIENGIIQKIISLFQNNRENLTSLSIEYLSALLLNLTLNPAGLVIVENYKNFKLFEIFLDILKDCPFSLRHFINGLLYSFFVSKKLRDKFNDKGHRETLFEQYSVLDDIFQRQLDHINERLRTSEEVSLQDSMKETDDTDNLLSCPEIDKNVDSIILQLKETYKLFFTDNVKTYSKYQFDIVTDYFEQFFKEDNDTISFNVTNSEAPLNRPSTPTYFGTAGNKQIKKSIFEKYNMDYNSQITYSSDQSNKEFKKAESEVKKSMYNEMKDSGKFNEPVEDDEPEQGNEQEEAETEGKEEFKEGFTSKPKIPRTPTLIQK